MRSELARPTRMDPTSGLGRGLVGLADASAAGALACALDRRGMTPTMAFTTRNVLRNLDHDGYDLVLLDVELAAAEIATFLAAVRSRTEGTLALVNPLPLAVDLGLLEPVVLFPRDGSVDEGLAQVLRAVAEGPPSFSAPTEYGPLRLDPRTRGAWWKGGVTAFTPTEFRLLEALCRAEGAVVGLRAVSRMVWNTAHVGDGGHVHACVSRIRRKIEADPSHPEFLLSVRGEGFRLVSEPAAVAV